MFYLTNGKYLNPNDLCQNEKIILVENVENKLMQSGLNLQVYKNMASEGINLFDLSSPFLLMFAFNIIQQKILL